jgi:hypothetical protein
MKERRKDTEMKKAREEEGKRNLKEEGKRKKEIEKIEGERGKKEGRK